MVTLANRIADWLAAEGQLPAERRAVLAYGALTALNTVLGMTLILLAGWITGLVGVILCAALVGASFRMLTGGAHYSAPWRCSSASAAIYLLHALMASWLANLPWNGPTLATLGAVMLAFSLWVTLRYAPADTKAYRLSPTKKARLRLLTVQALAAAGVGWTVALFAGVSPVWFLAAALGLGWQMFSVTPAGFAVFDSVDGLLKSVGIGGDNS